MPDSQDYRDGVKNEFTHVYRELKKISDTLSDVQKTVGEIKTQTILTNSRVTHLEGDIKEKANCQEVTDQNKEIEEVKKDVGIIKGDLLEYNFFKKYPKAGLIIMIFFSASVLFSGYTSLRNLKQKSKQNTELINKMDDIETRINMMNGMGMRGAPVIFNDSICEVK